MKLWILIVAVLLRVWGIGYGLPGLYHQDEPILVNHAMAVGVEGWNPKLFFPPPILTHGLFFLYGVLFVFEKALGVTADPSSFAIAFLKDPSLFYVLGRLFLGVLFGAGSVCLLRRMVARHVSEKAANGASLLFAVGFFHVQHSHYIYADIPLTFAVLLFLHCLLLWMDKPSFKLQLCTAATLGMAVAFKYTAIYFAPTAILALGLIQGRRFFVPRNIGALCVSILTTFGVFAALSPAVFLDWSTFWHDFVYFAPGRGFVGLFHHFSYSILNGVGISVLVLAGVGALIFWRHSARKAAVILFSFFSYYTVSLLYSQTFPRYILPIIPFVYFLAGIGWASVAELRWRRAVRIALLSFVFLESLAPTLYSNWLFSKQDTRDICREWVEQHVPKNARIVIDNLFFAPRLLQSEEQIREKYDRLEGLRTNRSKRKRLDLLLEAVEGKKTFNIYTLSFLEDDGKQSFLFEMPFLKPAAGDWRRVQPEYLIMNYTDPTPAFHDFKNQILPELELVAVFSPYRHPLRRTFLDPHGHTAAPHLLAELFSRVRLGPYLEVYKVRS